MNQAIEELNPALGEFLFVLRFLLQEWGKDNVILLVPETWRRDVPDVGIPINFATDGTVTILVDCPSHYIQYHVPASDLFLLEDSK